MRAAIAATALLLALAGPVMAAGCDADLKKIDAALAKDGVPADVKAQANDMRTQAADLCAAGNAEEAADVIAEAKSLLAIE